MIRFDKPCRHFVAIAGLIIILTTLITASILLRPDSTLAQGGPEQAQPSLTPPGPPPPLNSPIQTPEPGQKITTAAEKAAESDLEVIRFRPKLRLKRGQLGALSPKGVKPGNTGKIDYQKPPAGESIGPKEPYTPPDYKQLLAPQEWAELLYEDFEGVFPGNWILEDFSDDGGLFLDRQWGVTDYNSQYGSQSVWPAAGGLDFLDPWLYWYPDNLNSWMEYEFDFSNYADIFVSFGLWYDTEPEYDWVYFCISTDFENYSCDYWSGYSDGWLDQTYWLTSYAGYDQVWLAWTFETDESVSAGFDGPFVDEIYVWGYDARVTPTPTPTPDPIGQLIRNGSFEESGGSLDFWQTDSFSNRSAAGNQPGHRPSMDSSADQRQELPGASQPAGPAVPLSIGVTDTTYVEGQYSAFLTRSGGIGTDLLYQTFNQPIPTDVNDLVLNLWFAVTTFETEVETDWFCMSLGPADFSEIWVDLGCTDATDANGLWQELVYTLDEDELALVRGKPVTIFFELYNEGGEGSGTAGWVDFVQVYAIGGSGSSSLDPNEPNDDSTSATNITCSTPISGTIGEALGGYDVDWFVLTGVASGMLEIDINANTQVPPSELDSVVTLYDDSLTEVAWNDDDGVSYDSYISFDNQTPGATFYIKVESYSGYGSPNSFYELTAFCEGSGEGPPSGGNELPAAEDTWTVMLYLNAEDPNFVDALTQYREDIEAFIGGKSAFLKVVILYDGPGNNDTTRYLVQPNGNYTSGVNRWDNLGELNMGDPNTLINFITWAMDQYSAENYYLAIDDHGDGTYGISVDRTSNNDLLTPPEVYSALKSATHNGDPIRKIDIFDYEACLMGLAENAYDVRDWVNYVVFFEQISWAIDTYPTYFNDLAATDTPLEVGQRIIDRYYANALAANGGQGFPHTISLIEAGQMAAVGQAVSDLGDALQATGDQAGVKAARDASQAFANDDAATDPRRADYIDLWDLADKSSDLAPAQAAAVKAAVEAAVVAERHASGMVGGFPWIHDGAHGLSIYYPPNLSSNAFIGYPSLYQMSQDGDWDNFLNWAVTEGDRRGMSSARAEDRLITANDTFVFKEVFLPLIVK